MAEPYGKIGSGSVAALGNAQTTVERAAIQDATARLTGTVEYINGSIDRLDRIISRAFGDPLAGQSIGQEKLYPVPAGELGALSEVVGKLNDLAGRLGDRLDRIDRIV